MLLMKESDSKGKPRLLFLGEIIPSLENQSEFQTTGQDTRVGNNIKLIICYKPLLANKNITGGKDAIDYLNKGYLHLMINL